MTTITIYDPRFTYRASGGIGAYNTSLIRPDIFPPATIANIVSQYYIDLFRDTSLGVSLDTGPCPLNEPVCGSHLFVGDYSFIDPTPSFITNFTDATVVFAHQLSGIQVDIVGLNSGEVDASDCKIFGTNLSALQICITQSTTNPNGLLAGYPL